MTQRPWVRFWGAEIAAGSCTHLGPAQVGEVIIIDIIDFSHAHLQPGAVIPSIFPQKKVMTFYNYIMNIMYLLQNQKSNKMNSFYWNPLIYEILPPAVTWNGMLLRFYEWVLRHATITLRTTYTDYWYTVCQVHVHGAGTLSLCVYMNIGVCALCNVRRNARKAPHEYKIIQVFFLWHTYSLY